MRRYTIAKTLTLFLDALSVVARRLPERRSEINVHTPGVHRSSNPLTELGFADGNVDQDGDPKQRLERLGLVMVSEGVLDGNIHTATYSMSNNTAVPKRDTTLEKRRALQGASCSTVCSNIDGQNARPNPSDCEILYKNLYSTFGQFTLQPSGIQAYNHGACLILFVNHFPDTVTYDFWDFGGTVEWLTGDCIIRQQFNIGRCLFGDIFDTSSSTTSIIVSHPSSSALFI